MSIQYGIIHISSENDALNVINVEEVVIHNNFLPGNGYLNDIGMLKVRKSHLFTNLRKTILTSNTSYCPITFFVKSNQNFVRDF